MNDELTAKRLHEYLSYDPKTNQRWRAYIKVSGVQRHIGTFDTKEEAIAARSVVAKQVFGEFARVS